MEDTSLRLAINPVFTTAQSCLQINAAVGDQDSRQVLQALGFPTFAEASQKNAKNVPPELVRQIQEAMPAFFVLPEARFWATIAYAERLGVRQFVDLPCGYTARGVKLARTDVRYFGFDLPAVIDAMTPAVKPWVNERIRYRAVDATNYASLRDGLRGAEGELFISTEGMLMYLDQSELTEVFRNIHRLLSEFGGRWVTMDNTLALAQPEIFKAILGGDGAESEAGLRAAGKMSDATLENNRFFDPDRSRAAEFVREMGFELTKVPIGPYLPETLHAFDTLPEGKRAAGRAQLEQVCFWVMTVQDKDGAARKQKGFSMRAETVDGLLTVRLSGRLDTMTAEPFWKRCKEENAERAIVDMAELDYVSSAGLRVLLMMKKELRDLRLRHVNENVMNILKQTGFDQLLTVE